MRILKILLVSTCLTAFGAGAALAATTPLASTGQTTVKPKSTKLTKKKVVKNKHVKPKSNKKKFAKATKTKPAPSTDETAPGSPPPGKTE